MIIELLEKELHEMVLESDEIYIVSGLISTDGAKKLCDELDENVNADWDNIHIIVGIDMPTPADALRTLKKLRDDHRVDVSYYAKKGYFFHPKVYLFGNEGECVAYVGSANYTSAGLGKNIELTAKITDKQDCRRILNWINRIREDSRFISDSMLDRYRKTRGKKHDLDNVDDFKTKESEYYAKELMSLLRKCRQDEDTYEDYCDERADSLEDLERIIDKDGGFKRFDIKEFCKEEALGWIIPVYSRHLKDAKREGKLLNLCTMLTNEKLSLAKRVNLAMTDPRYQIYGAGINFISKILTVLYPKKCFLWNNASIWSFKALGNKLRTGLSVGEKYECYCNYYSQIMDELDIENFAVLDRMLYYIKTGR